jgi:pseudouridine synthase
VNGATVTTLGSRASRDDRILVDGRPLPPPAELRYVALNKPVGFTTTLRDPEGRPTVRDLLPPAAGRLFPVGRLDLQSTGLVLMTNDGELAARLTHPRHHVPRTYRVKVSGRPELPVLERMRRGMRLDGGPPVRAEVTVEKVLPTKTWLRVTVFEGRNHLVRRLCHAVGHGAEKLERVAIGPLALGSLARGAFRLLVPAEIAALRRTAGLGRGRTLGRASSGRRRTQRV